MEHKDLVSCFFQTTHLAFQLCINTPDAVRSEDPWDIVWFNSEKTDFDEIRQTGSIVTPEGRKALSYELTIDHIVLTTEAGSKRFDSIFEATDFIKETINATKHHACGQRR
jgi:hypothetical protein